MLILNQLTVAVVLVGNDVRISDVLDMTNILELSPFADSLQGKSMFFHSRRYSKNENSKPVHCSAIYLGGCVNT